MRKFTVEQQDWIDGRIACALELQRIDLRRDLAKEFSDKISLSVTESLSTTNVLWNRAIERISEEKFLVELVDRIKKLQL